MIKYEVVKTPYFKHEFIINKNGWDLTKISKFPHYNVLSADTETKLYYNDGKLVNDEELYNYLHEQKKNKKFKLNSWLKENINVHCYAFTLSNGQDFVLFQCIEDFIKACCLFNVERVFWFNAKFDWAIFDYYLLDNNWVDVSTLPKEFKNKKLSENHFDNLIGECGERYQLTLWGKCKDYYNRDVVRKFKMLDLLNITSGSLANNLKSWQIEEDDGNALNKLEMNYNDASIFNDNDLDYMRNDVVGLHKLAIKINDEFQHLCGYSLFDGHYITIGGLSKKTLLNYMFQSNDFRLNLKKFQKFMPMTKEYDALYRSYKLYKGGICVVNPWKINKTQHNIYKYDVNSMYPDKMRNMKYAIGEPKFINPKNFKEQENKCYVFRLKNFNGFCKKNMIPMYLHSITGKYEIAFREIHDILMWKEELDMLHNYYDLEYEITDIFEFDAMHSKYINLFVDTFYDIKSNTKGSKKQCAKLVINSSYGKFAEKIERVKTKIELNELGIVHLVNTEEIDVDEKNIMSVLNGSRITMLSRVDLMKHILMFTNNNPKKYFIYCDTDSIACLKQANEDVDDKELGKYKCEGIFENGIYLAPKTYMLSNNNQYEVHCKGVNVKVVKDAVDGKSWQDALKIFKPKVEFKTLCGLNVKGGKALVYLDKCIVKDIPICLEDKDIEIINQEN